MPHIRLIALAVAGSLISSGFTSAQEIAANGLAGSSSSIKETLPEALGVCGPFHRAICEADDHRPLAGGRAANRSGPTNETKNAAISGVWSEVGRDAEI
jgi:hypothetical protein